MSKVLLQLDFNCKKWWSRTLNIAFFLFSEITVPVQSAIFSNKYLKRCFLCNFVVVYMYFVIIAWQMTFKIVMNTTIHGINLLSHCCSTCYRTYNFVYMGALWKMTLNTAKNYQIKIIILIIIIESAKNWSNLFLCIMQGSYEFRNSKKSNLKHFIVHFEKNIYR